MCLWEVNCLRVRIPVCLLVDVTPLEHLTDQLCDYSPECCGMGSMSKYYLVSDSSILCLDFFAHDNCCRPLSLMMMYKPMLTLLLIFHQFSGLLGWAWANPILTLVMSTEIRLIHTIYITHPFLHTTENFIGKTRIQLQHHIFDVNIRRCTLG